MQGQPFEPVFKRETVGSALVLTIQREFKHRDYVTFQHEYNDVFAQLDSGFSSLLFDMRECRHLESVLIGMLVSLTLRIRDLGGDAAMCGLSGNVLESLDALMLLQPGNKRAAWRQFPDRESALAWLSVSTGELQ